MRFAFAPLSAFNAPLLPDAGDIAGKLPRLAWKLKDLYKKFDYSPYVQKASSYKNNTTFWSVPG
jgi:hypothetical protein